MKLKVLSHDLSVCKLEKDMMLSAWATAGKIWSVTKTEDELSIVCETSFVPSGVSSTSGWRALMVQGPLDFSLVGIMAELSSILANAKISIFVLSTFDTDYILVKNKDLSESINALKLAGHEVIEEVRT